MFTSKILSFIFIFSLISLKTYSSSFIVRDYFDGYKWHLGPFHFVIEGNKIKEIKGPFSQSGLDREVAGLKSSKKSYYFFPHLDLIPGLIDSHVHLAFEDRTFDHLHDQGIRRMFSDDRSSRDLAHRRIDSAIKRGFLTIRDLGGSPNTLQEIYALTKKNPNRYPQLFFVKKALAPSRGQCPEGVYCKGAFVELPQSSKSIENYFQNTDSNVHSKIFLDNDPYPGVLKKEHILNILKVAKKKKAPIAIHTVKQRSFSWLVSSFYPQVSLEHLNQFTPPTNPLVLKDFINSGLKLVPTLYSSSFTAVLKKRNKLPSHWQWDRINQLKKIKSLKGLKSMLCFGSDFYYQTFSPLRDSFYYSIEVLKDYQHEIGLAPDEVLRMATGACHELFPGTSAGVISSGAQASFNLVGGDLKSDIKYLHDIQGTVNNGVIYRIP